MSAHKKATRNVVPSHPQWQDFDTPKNFNPNFVPSSTAPPTEEVLSKVFGSAASAVPPTPSPLPSNFFSQFQTQTRLAGLPLPEPPMGTFTLAQPPLPVAPLATFSFDLPPPSFPTTPLPAVAKSPSMHQPAKAVRSMMRSVKPQEETATPEPPAPPEPDVPPAAEPLLPWPQLQANVERDPTRNPAIAPAGASPFASLPNDLLRTVLQSFCNVFDLLVLRLVCRRWLEAIRGISMAIDLQAAEYMLLTPSHLGSLTATFPRIYALRVVFSPSWPMAKSARRRRPRKAVEYEMNDQVISPLFTLTDLLSLSLSLDFRPKITAAALRFSALQSLKTLSFGHVAAAREPDADSFVAAIADAPSLTSLSLRIPLLGSSGLASLTKLTSLVELDISWAPKLTTLAPLTALTTLERLMLSGSTDNVPLEDVRAVAALPRLLALRLTLVEDLLDLYADIRKTHPLLHLTFGS